MCPNSSQNGALKASLQRRKGLPDQKQLKKDKHESYSEPQQVETVLRGINTRDTGLEAAKTTVAIP